MFCFVGRKTKRECLLLLLLPLKEMKVWINRIRWRQRYLTMKSHFNRPSIGMMLRERFFRHFFYISIIFSCDDHLEDILTWASELEIRNAFHATSLFISCIRSQNGSERKFFLYFIFLTLFLQSRTTKVKDRHI